MSTPKYLNRFTNSMGNSLYFILGYGGATTSCTSSAFVLFILTGMSKRGEQKSGVGVYDGGGYDGVDGVYDYVDGVYDGDYVGDGVDYVYDGDVVYYGYDGDVVGYDGDVVYVMLLIFMLLVFLLVRK
ncbi:unnamed protein product [Rotaria socialis]